MVEVSGTSQDGVDELSDHTAEIEISPSDAGQWSDAIVTLATRVSRRQDHQRTLRVRPPSG